MTNSTQDTEGQQIENAWREGWWSGYRSGMVDGGSDSCWSDVEGDWLKSEAASLKAKAQQQ